MKQFGKFEMHITGLEIVFYCGKKSAWLPVCNKFIMYDAIVKYITLSKH